MRQQNLFERRAREELWKAAPLAERMRPLNIEEMVGQIHLLGSGKIIDRMLRHRQLYSFIFWGPPGSGKTTLAKIIAAHSQAHLIALSAVMAGTKEIKSAVDEAKVVWAKEKRRTCLFMDEIHRLNKAQQDALLPHVENGTLVLFGATTENPSFEIIRPLLSRTKVLVLDPLSEEDLKNIIYRALKDDQKGLGEYTAKLTKDALDYLAGGCGGDARVALNALEMAVLTTPPDENGVRVVDAKTAAEAVDKQAVHYDKSGEEHFNLISALHKSVRGSDPDASLYWLARMLQAGEDPIYIARRLVRMASEDIGLADPFALVHAISGLQSYQLLGSPEGDLALAQVAVYLALAPKSNKIYAAFGEAKQAAEKTSALSVPLHLRNAPTELLKKLGYGKQYLYPHDHPDGWIAEIYFPDAFGEESFFYHPTSRGWEGKWRGVLEKRRRQVKIKRAKKGDDRDKV